MILASHTPPPPLSTRAVTHPSCSAMDGSAKQYFRTCCHTETDVADPTHYPIQSQYSNTGPTSHSTDPNIPGARQGSHRSANFEVTGMTRLGKKIPSRKAVVIVCWLLNVPATGYSVSQGRICTDNFTCCRTETKVADQTFYLAQSWYTDTGPTSPSADPISQAPGRVPTWVTI